VDDRRGGQRHGDQGAGCGHLDDRLHDRGVDRQRGRVRGEAEPSSVGDLARGAEDDGEAGQRHQRHRAPAGVPSAAGKEPSRRVDEEQQRDPERRKASAWSTYQSENATPGSGPSSRTPKRTRDWARPSIAQKTA
jgi:hypothetical protein